MSHLIIQKRHQGRIKGKKLGLGIDEPKIWRTLTVKMPTMLIRTSRLRTKNWILNKNEFNWQKIRLKSFLPSRRYRL